MNDKHLTSIASVGLALGGLLGMAGTFAQSAALRGLAWGIDGVGIVVASALLTVVLFRRQQDLAAAGFLVLAIGEGIILSSAAMDLTASTPSFGAGVSLWAAALVLISSASVFPTIARLLGHVAAVLFAFTAARIFTGAHITPVSSPMPFYAYPVFVATLFSWIWTLTKGNAAS